MRRAGAAMATLAVLAAPAAAQVSTDPAFHVLAEQQYLRSLQRGHDQAANPEYQARYLPYAADFIAKSFAPEEPHRPGDVDPFRLHWGCAELDSPAICSPRGHEVDLSITNRYGARMHGHLSIPLDRSQAPFPAVIFLTGASSSEQPYRGLVQGLAEEGYVVLSLAAQGDAGSQQKAPDPVPSTPQNEYCKPHDHKGWQQPQEMGIVETGECAGQPVGPAETPVDTALFVAGHGEDVRGLEAAYQGVKARKTFGALDAVAWLLSDANPERAVVDADRLGIMGHSLGAHAALLAGNGDPQRRFDAVVSLEGYGSLAPSAEPTIPTMFQLAEGNDFGPHTERPVADGLRSHMDAERFAEADVPTMVVALSGSTHQEFNYLPFPQHAAPVATNASRDGERVSLHYALAWLDRWLGEDPERSEATGRLLAPTFAPRVDASSIGQGPYDPLAGRNSPPTIAGESASHHLSPLYRSFANFDGAVCPDLRAGCDGG